MSYHDLPQYTFPFLFWNEDEKQITTLYSLWSQRYKSLKQDKAFSFFSFLSTYVIFSRDSKLSKDTKYVSLNFVFVQYFTPFKHHVA